MKTAVIPLMDFLNTSMNRGNFSNCVHW
jgi:hypothetical protein